MEALWQIKRAIIDIRKHHKRGDDVHAMCVDLGMQVAGTSGLQDSWEKQMGRDKSPGRGRRITKQGHSLEDLKKFALKVYKETYNQPVNQPYGNSKNKRRAYRAAKHQLSQRYKEIRSLRTIESWIRTSFR